MVEWESSKDLYSFITAGNGELIQILNKFMDSVQILEVGCGTALPTRGILEILYKSGYGGKITVTLQDYEQRTIDEVSKPSIARFMAALPDEFISRVNILFLASPWESLDIDENAYHLILSSECIYREDLFAALSRVLVSSLHADGLCLVSGKRYYFGCGGGSLEFSLFMESRFPWLSVDLVHTVEDGSSNTREILAIHSKVS